MSRRLQNSVLPLIAIAALSAAMFAPQTGVTQAVAGSGDAGARCDVRVAKRGGGTSLEAIVVSPVAVSGSYRLSATASGGGTDVDQSGAFQARAGEATSLGTLVLPSPGGYSAELTVKWPGGSVSCTQAVSGKL
jgi:hypothetical protein